LASTGWLHKWRCTFVFGSMLIVAWVMSDPVNYELMGRLVMHRLSPFAEMTYVY
jgi:hypothetical protein